MRITHLRPVDYRTMPWKNGLGVTTEIARFPLEGTYDWRVSIASVESDGPFSKFPGFDRVILVTEGAGMTLTHRDVGIARSVSRLEAWSFSGDWDTECVLSDGTIRDFNVITRRHAWECRVFVVRAGARSLSGATGISLVYCVSGQALFVTDEKVALQAGETVIVECEPERAEVATLQPADGAILILVELSARDARGPTDARRE